MVSVYLDCFYGYWCLACVLDVDYCVGWLGCDALDLYGVACSGLHCYENVDYCGCGDEEGY